MRRKRERRGQRRKEERGAVCLPLTLSLWEPQNGLCQQNTDLLSWEEHEDEREGWEERKGREKYYHGILQVCVLYGTPYISLITRNVVKIYEHHWAWVKNFNMQNPSLLGEYQLHHCNIFQSTDAVQKTPANVSTTENNSLNWFFFLCPTVKNWFMNASFHSPL